MEANVNFSNVTTATPNSSFVDSSDSQEARVASLTFLVLNAAVSLVGNSLSLAVFTRSRLRGAPSSGYLASLAVADTGSAVTAALGIAFSMYGTPSTFFFCNVVFFLSYVFQFLAVWLLVCFTAERFVSVCHPLRSRLILSKFREWRVVLLFVVVGCAMYIPILAYPKVLEFETQLQIWTCDWLDDEAEVTYLNSFAYVTFASHFAVPMVTIGILNGLIIRQLCKNYHAVELRTHVNDEREARNKYVTVTLLVVCLVFFVCHFPFNLIYLLILLDISVNRWVYRVCQNMFKLSYSTNFFLYALSGSLFRNSLKTMIGANSRKESFQLRMTERTSASSKSH